MKGDVGVALGDCGTYDETYEGDVGKNAGDLGVFTSIGYVGEYIGESIVKVKDGGLRTEGGFLCVSFLRDFDR